MNKIYWWSLKEVRETVFNNKISMSTLQGLVTKNKIPSERFGSKRIFIPNWWVEKQIEAGSKEI